MHSVPEISIARARTTEEARPYEELLRRVFQEELGLAVDDENSGTHAGCDGTLLCLCGGEVVAGLKMFYGDLEKGRLVPMEHDGIQIDAYHRAHFPVDGLYAEVCRVVIDPAYRRYRLHARLLEAATTLLPQDGCHVVYWLAKRSQAVNSHRSLRGMGLAPRIVDSLVIQRAGESVPRERVLSVIELPRVAGAATA